MPAPTPPNQPTNGHAPSTPAGNGLLYGADEPADMGESLRKTLGMLWQGKWIILAVVLLIVGGTALYVAQLPNEYETSSLLLVETQQRPVTQGIDVGIEQAIGLNDRTLDNEMLVLRNSDVIAERVARRLMELEQAPETGEPLSVVFTEEGQKRSVDQVVGRLRSHMRTGRAGRDVDAINIVGTSTVPGEAALIANVYAEEYIGRTQETSRASVQASREFLERQEQQMSDRLQQLENQIAEYMRREGATNLDQETSRLVTQIAEMEARRDEAQIELDMRRASMNRLEDELNQIEPQLTERAASNTRVQLRTVQEEIADLEARREMIYQRNPALREAPNEHESLQDLNRRIAELERRAETLADQYVRESLAAGAVDPSAEGQGLSYVAEQQRELAQRRIEVSGLEAQLNALNQRLASYRTRLDEIPSQSIELAEMQRARQTAERLYIFLREKLQEVQMAEESEIGYAEVVRPAYVPSSPVRPNKQRSLMMALFLSLLLGSGLVYLRNKLDTRLHHPSDLRERGHNLMGAIPDMAPLIDDDFGGQERIQVDGRSVNTSLPMLLSPMSAPSEAFRRLRTNIQFSRPDTVVQTLLVTSPEMGEGKSTTVANLALAMAQAARKTVIVDTDLRRPQMHKMLDLPREPGLSDLLFDRTELKLETFATGIDNLYVIPAGSAVPNPSELVGSKKMRELIAELRDRFDVILFDSPPALAFSDAMLLSTQCDGSVIVAAADQTDARAFAHTYETLEDVGAFILGGILNRFDADAAPYGYGYGYGYGYAHQYRRTNRYYGNERKAKQGRFKAWLDR